MAVELPSCDYTIHPDGQKECPGKTTSCLRSLTYFNTVFLSCCATRICRPCSALLHPKPPCDCRLCCGIVLGSFQHEKQINKRHLQWARAGNAEAQHHLGMNLRSGTIKRSLEDSMYWLTKAAEQGHTIAAANLAIIFMKGDGVPQSETDGFKWMKVACDRGYDTYYLGMMMQEGFGCEVDMARGSQLLHRSLVFHELNAAVERGMSGTEAFEHALKQCGLREDEKEDSMKLIMRELQDSFAGQSSDFMIDPLLKQFGVAEGMTFEGQLPMPKSLIKGFEHKCVECGNVATRKCSACKGPHYCSDECQRSGWKEHKQYCKFFQQMNYMKERGEVNDEPFESAEHFKQHRRQVKQIKSARKSIESVLPSQTFVCCAHCGSTANLQKCASCQAVEYCSRKCQKADWKKHRTVCKRHDL